MANIINKVLLSDGPKKAMYQFYFESDGAEGELTNYQLLDPNSVGPVEFGYDFVEPWDKSGYPQGVQIVPPSRMTILQMWSSASWFDMTLSYDGTLPLPSFVIARDSDFYMDFRYFGGIKDRVVDQPTGKLLISTKDFAPLGSNGFLVIEIKKD